MEAEPGAAALERPASWPAIGPAAYMAAAPGAAAYPAAWELSGA